MITRTIVMHPRSAGMPTPALRLWTYMITRGSYKGTPSDLCKEFRGDVLGDELGPHQGIAQRSLPGALDWLEQSGMLRVYRKGSFLEVHLVAPTEESAA